MRKHWVRVLVATSLVTWISGCDASFELADAAMPDASSIDASAGDASVGDASAGDARVGDGSAEDASTPTTILEYEPLPGFDVDGPISPEHSFQLIDQFPGRAGPFELPGSAVHGSDLKDLDRDGDLDLFLLHGAGLPPRGPIPTNSVVLRNTVVGTSTLGFESVVPTIEVGEYGDRGTQLGLYFAPLSPGLVVTTSPFGDGWAYRGTDDPMRFGVEHSRVHEGHGDVRGTRMMVGDLSRDGRPDLLTAMQGHETRADFRVGVGWEQQPRDFLPENVHSMHGAWVADFDDDGVLDVLTMPYGLPFSEGEDDLAPHEPHLLLGRPEGGFESTRETVDLEGSALNAANHAVADFDGDGRLDLFEIGWRIDPAGPPGAPREPGTDMPAEPATLRVLYGGLQDGALTFTPVPVQVPVGEQPPTFDTDDVGGAMSVGDFDLDGHLDVATIARGGVRIFFGTRTRGHFRYASNGYSRVFVTSLMVGDIDLDGDLDFVGSGNGIDIKTNQRNGPRFIELWLRDGADNPEAIGATVWLMPAGRGGDRSAPPLGRRDVMLTSVQPSPTMVHFGLPGDDEAFDLEIRWPGESARSVVRNVPLGARIVVRRPE